MKRILLIVIVLIGIVSIEVFGQEDTAAKNDLQNSVAGDSPKTPSSAKFKCLCGTDSLTIDSIRGLNSMYNHGNTFSMDEYMVVYIKENVDTLFKYNTKKDLMLWFDGIPFPNLRVWQANTCLHQLIFSLKRDTAVNSSWNYIYGYAYRGWFQAIKTVNVQVGTDQKCLTYFNDNTTIHIKFREPWMMWVGYPFIAALLIFFYWLIKRRNILQDSLFFDDSVKIIDKFSEDSTNEVLKKDVPYSLARSQLLFWILLVAISIIFIWINTDDLAVLTTSTAVLIGISGGTSVLTKIIEANKVSTVKITATQFYSGKKSETFLSDILSDEKGYSVARVQMFIFTIIIGFYFCWHVIYNLQMPNFSDGLLLLMGVSSSTYAGVKFSEKA